MTEGDGVALGVGVAVTEGNGVALGVGAAFGVGEVEGAGGAATRTSAMENVFTPEAGPVMLLLPE